MSSALERVIAEQQKEIDRLKLLQAQNIEASRKLYDRQQEMLEAIGRLVDYTIAGPGDKEYQRLRHEARGHLLKIGFCFGCYSIGCNEGCYE